jgi:hypothetical protein
MTCGAGHKPHRFTSHSAALLRLTKLYEWCLQVEFEISDAISSGSAAEPRVLFCTQGGILGVAGPADGAPQQRQDTSLSSTVCTYLAAASSSCSCM